MKNSILYFLFPVFFAGCVFPFYLHSSENNGVISNLKFSHISTSDGLPSNEVQKVFQDREGFIWFATRYGFCKYDGYKITTFKSNLNSPSVLTNNNIICLTDDANRNLWLGTLEGLHVYNKETGEIRKCNYPGIDHNPVLCLLVTKDNALWLGNRIGLFRYDREADKMILYSGATANHPIPETPITYLYEDSDGDLWIGTRTEGFYRYDLQNNLFYSYSTMRPRNAHIIYEDSSKQIWIIGWDEGLFLLNNPKDMSLVSCTNYRYNPNDDHSLQDNMAYDLYEDINMQTLWIGTRSGISIMKLDKPGKFINYKTIKFPYHIPFDEANSIIRDISGKMWIGTIGNGVYTTDTQKQRFNLYRFKQKDESITTTSIRSIFVDDDNRIWFGLGTYGVARYDRNTNQYTYYSNIPEFSEIRSMPTVYAIMKRKQTGELWIGSYDGGLFVYKKGEKVRHYDNQNTDFIIHHCVTALFEDSKGNCWVGTREGIGVKRANGTGYLFNNIEIEGENLSSSYIRKITESENNKIWIATNNNGVISISGNVSDPRTIVYERYSYDKKINVKNIQTLLFDSKGRLWAGTEGYGLFLYNKERNIFESKNMAYNLPCDMIGSIEEDVNGCLWLGSNIGLMQLKISEDAENASLHIYTTADGLQDDSFIPRSSFTKNKEMFFGGHNGFNSFFPDKITEKAPAETPLYITDIKIFNNSLSSLDKKIRAGISEKEAPYTDKITLSHKQNNLSIEFASLTYKNPELNNYAHKLENFDPDWIYTDANHHSAYYNNLKSGKYIFKLRATNENGDWNRQVRELQVIILPPPWATGWAYLCYTLLVIAVSYLIYRNIKNRLKLKNRLYLQKMEQSKTEEINHAKLQFFTNITHELLTPLTIISATVDELKMQAPQYTALYPAITTNIKRLIRLLQQILEFRKAETGNLKLRVSSGDIAAFIRNEAEAFLPLIKKRKLHFSVICDPESITGYFDTDKLDKILYNLLSNAAKYSNEGGFIQVNLSCAENRDSVLITIKDNGTGISPEKQKTLFKRFYEGDYRKLNTIGTGIGLSLVKDLVELHNGSIRLESEPDKGSVFSVRLPIERSCFKQDEIDDEVVYRSKAPADTGPEMPAPAQPTNETKKHSILILEDNDELLNLMINLFNREYRVFTGENGKEGMVVIENEDVDLVVSDIMMPEMNGIEFCQWLKGKIEFCHIPILLLTAKNKEEDRAEAYESGADGFISKPFNLAVLHARIKNLIKAKERIARDFKNQLVFEVKDLNYTSLDEEFMQKAIDCVNRRLDDPDFDQMQFMEEMGTSKSTLYRKLKSLTGLNTSAFIRNIRLKAAVGIISEKKYIRISELAYAVGFNDPKYFSSCFKKQFGMLPSEYIERYMPEQQDSSVKEG